MSADFKYFPDVFSEVVDEVKKDYDLVNLLPFFEYGSYLELMGACKVKDNNQTSKYPLIWLVWDGAENTENWKESYIYSISPKVFICDLSNIDDDTAQRYANTLKATLYPIFDLLLSKLGYHPNIELNSEFKYTVIAHPFWLNTDGSFDTLSSIEIKFENLLLLKN
jgi:hypothetical protein